MSAIASIEELEEIYGPEIPAAKIKVQPLITPLYQQWIDASRFLILSTVGPEGTDASPRGDDGPVVKIVDSHTIHLPDWKGNNRVDSLRNIVRDGRVSLMFMVPGNNNVVRVNGTGIVSRDAHLIQQFEKQGKQPRTVIVITIEEVYYQCAKALMRSRLWSQPPEECSEIPTAGQFRAEVEEGFDAAAYDKGYAEYAKPRFW